ncbi:conserved phage C-terminal domain-containing protein [Limosilactobacillus reuteri]|uniref:conserved phage C-terminal domain-containing protein n=1 Tax=Limosilactobacillus reuteri TaxID=1598 RepID=UPI00214AE953|nr:conserved phage C-terminal domain-containing protein [Limosilactobacillus reuteri]MCR1878957.1 conserved phage C-terminal domain-containing protein [Limosilactobacillus reuteri]
MAKIKKVYQKRFTTVDNTVLNDESVTWKAKGLFTYLWSKPDNWNYSVKEVSRHAKDGRDSTSDGVQELEAHGYLKREQINKKGSFGSSIWTLSERPIFKKQIKNDKPTTPNTDNPLPEEPLTGKPSTDLPMTEKSSTENPALLNTDIQNTDNTNKRLTKDNKGQAQPAQSPIAAQRREVIQYLNQKTGKHFKPDADGNKRIIEPRLKEGYTVDEMKKIIDNMYSLWHGVTFRNGELGDNYLKPETLFRSSKIDGYLNATPSTANSQRQRYGKRPPINEPMPEWFKQQQEQEKQGKPDQGNWMDQLPDESEVPMPDD